ncbi:MAG: kelch repeat-containing protein [Myxococcales bacterium]
MSTAAALAACSADVKGPAPNVEPPSAEASPPPVDPEIVCRDQLTTTVTLNGENFSPVPIDIPDAPKLSLPDVVLTRSHALDGAEVSEPDVTLWSGDPDADPTNAYDAEGEPLVEWKSRQEMSFTINQDLILGELEEGQELPAEGEEDPRDRGVLAEGVWDVRVENANGQVIDSLQSLAVVKKPEVAELTPGITCLDQGSRTITLDGQRFLRNEGDEALLEVEGVDAPFEMSLSECTDIDHAGLDAEVCDRVEVELAEGSIDTGFPGLVIQNPETAACNSEEDIKLRVVPPPSIDRVAPPMACVAEGERTFTIEGQDFLRIDGGDPLVTIGGMDFDVDAMGGCEALDTQGHDVERCSSIDITIAQDQLDPDLYEVTVRNPDPAGCDNTATGALRIVPPPTIDDIQPPLVCLDDGSRDVTVTGSDFLVVDGEKPAVEMDGAAITADAVAPDGCSDLEVDGLTVQRCDTLVVTLAMNEVGVGMPDVTVTNPDPAGCSDQRNDQLRVIEGPTISAAVPALVCTDDGDRAVVIQGEGFLKIGDDLPAVTIGAGAVKSVDSVDDCSEVGVDGLTVESCTTINVTVEQGALSEGMPQVSVTNPGPAGCSVADSTVLTVPPALAITSVSPSNLCAQVATGEQITISGAGFLRVDGTDPVLTIAGNTVTPDAVQDCVDVTVADGSTVETCDTILATVTPSMVLSGAAGDVEIGVTNPAPSGCAQTATGIFRIVPPPDVTSITPVRVCSDVEETITVEGTDFAEGAVVRIGTDCDQASPTECVIADSVTFVDDTELTATFDNGLPPGLLDVTVENGASCLDTEADLLTVDPTPLIFFVDPPVAFNGINLDATIFTTGLTATAAMIELVDDGMNATAITEFSTPVRPNRIQATIPDGLAPGSYEVRITSDLGCVGAAPGVLDVTGEETVAVTDIEPGYVSPTVDTAVTISAKSTGDLTGDEVNFESTPRVYLNPNPNLSDDVSRALEATVYVDETTLTAIIPAGLDPDTYDLIVVNPSGAVGRLLSGVVVTGAEPPVIESVIPASLKAGASDTLTLTGSGFDEGGTAPTVELDCLLSDGTTRSTVTGTGVSVDAGGESASVTVDLSTGDNGNPGAGSICVVRIINPDQSSFDYSAFSVTNSSYNLASWEDAQNMTVARRGPALVAGRPTNTSRFLFAIGGDSGAASAPDTRGTVLDSAEAATVDVFGTMGTWSAQRNDLSAAVVASSSMAAPRTQAGSATIGRFVYVVGGYDGTSATDTLLRAEVLDPLAAPQIADLDAALGDGVEGLGGGQWFYRVAAAFPIDDPNNPGGESLPGEVLPVQLPDREENIILTLDIEGIEDATGYRIYRSPTVDGSAENLELLAVCPGAAGCDCSGADPVVCSYDDTGTATTGGVTPLPSGSLGVWHAADTAERCADADCALSTPREGLATVAVQDPAQADTYYLYAFGGRDDVGTYLDTYEVAVITVDDSGLRQKQVVADWVAGSDTLDSPRADLAAWVLRARNSALIRGSGSPEDVWIYVGSGRTNMSTAEGQLDAGLVGAAGDLGTFIAEGSFNGLWGLGAGASNDQLYTFGGTTSSSGSSAALCGSPPVMGGGGCSAGVTDPPDLTNPNSLGNASTDRQYMGYTQESAFFFLAGGHDGDTTLSTTEKTVQ